MGAKGKFYDGKTSSSQNAELNLWGTSIEIVLENGEQLIFLHNQIKVEKRLGNTPRNIRLPEGAKFSSSDHAFIDTYLKRSKLDINYHLESNTKLILGSLGVFIGAIALLYFIALPVLSKSLAPHIPEDISKALGDQTENFLLDAYFEPRTNVSIEKIKKLRQFVDKMQKYLPDQKINLIVQSSPKIGPNAFALPNGTIIVTDQLIEKSENMDEVYAVLLHEVGHIFHHHSMQRLIANSVLSLAVFVILGPVDWTGIPIFLMLSAYSREAETEADAFAAFNLLEENKDPRLLTNILKRMSEGKEDSFSQSIPSLLLSHPLTSEREKNINLWKAKPESLPYQFEYGEVK